MSAGAEDEVFDLAIIGGGIVGASIAYFAAAGRRVVQLEAESQPGYHATGRSAALFTEAYGPPMVRALTRASRDFFDGPPSGFAGVPLLHPRGTLFVGSDEQRQAVDALHRTLLDEGARPLRLAGADVRSLVPVLRPEACAHGVLDTQAFDVDVDALLQGFLRGARARGAQLRTNAQVASLAHDGDAWRIVTQDGASLRARTLVNAAGAWLDQVAALAGARLVGIEPRRRSAFLFEAPAGASIERWPAVIAIDETWYFKPDAGLLLGSPANADPVAAHDVVAEEFDVALGIYQIEQATTMEIRRPRSTWAGLRSFVADGEPVCGFDELLPGFFWAGAVGGYGIQSAPAFGRLCAALACEEPLPDDIAREGLALEALAPRRLQGTP